MKHSLSFRHGGISLVSKTRRQLQPVSNAFLPNHALLIFREHEDAQEPELIVNEGQQVVEGQLLAKGHRSGSLNLHAPVPGLIRKVLTVPTPEGYQTKALVLSLFGQFRISGKVHEHNYWHSLNRHEILYLLQDKGVADTTTGKPLHECMAAAQEANILIVNCVDTDAYPFHEIDILHQYVRIILEACQIVQKASKITRLIFALNASAPRELLEQIAQTGKDLSLEYSINFFSDKYPQAYPNQICQALKIGKTESQPFFLSPSTLYAIHTAVNYNRPHVNQFVFLGGDALKTSRLLKTRIGTPIGKLIEECGGFVGSPDMIAVNNPFASGHIIDLDTPVSRSVRAVWVLSRHQTHFAPTEKCIRCGSCSRVCPESLDPYRMYKLLRAGRKQDVQSQLAACSTCGACSAVCRSRIPLSISFKKQQREDANAE